MSKKSIIGIFIALIVLTNVVTFTVTNFINVKMDNKVVITKEEYDTLSKLYEENSKVIMVRRALEDLYLREIDDQALLDGQLKGMVDALEDPYSVYMTESEYSSFNINTDGVYGGVGIIVTPGEDNFITVVSPIEDTPGERAGIKTGDKIIKVDGVEYFSSNMDEAVSVMRGEPDTDVELTILRTNKESKNETIVINLTREIIKLVSVKSDVINGDIGYIRLTSFDKVTTDDFRNHLTELENKNIKGLVLDLRGNPGGLLNVSTEIADELLGEETIVYTQDKNGKRNYAYSDKDLFDLPLVVLINQGSASASEILAGAIKDNERGTLIGTTTFGKGVVQTLRDLPDGTGLKVTISEYFTPNGINIHGVGIAPDVEVELDEDVEGIGLDFIDVDNQLQKAIEVLREKL